MTATTPDPKPRRTTSSSRTAGTQTEPVREVCPYLEAAGGGWRSVEPTRDHRCMATAPASPLSLSKQRELCLQPAHFGCATYQAARELATDTAGPADGGLWPETRGAILSLEPPRGARTGVPGLAGRGGGQAVLILLMVVAFVLLAITRVTPSVSGDPPGSVDAGVVASLPPVATASLPATPSPTASDSGSAAPASSSTPSASPATSAGAPTPSGSAAAPSQTAATSPAGTTYKVKTGDTLSGIAARYGVTVRALKAANGITDGGLIRPGQALLIPTSP